MRRSELSISRIVGEVLAVLAMALGFSASVAAAGEAANSRVGPITVITFNTGTTHWLPHNRDRADGYTSREANISRKYYQNGLSWSPAIRAVSRYLAAAKPDIIALQEIFHSDECESIPETQRRGFVCDGWKKGDPTVARTILGEDYTIACIPGRADKCLSVRVGFGAIRGCQPGSFCIDGLAGTPVANCGGAARHGLATIEHIGGGSIVAVAYHATSGLQRKDSRCRIRQVDQIRADLEKLDSTSQLGTIVLGDFNIDPVRNVDSDESAAHLANWVETSAFEFYSEIDENVEDTYPYRGKIDHVLGKGFDGDCRSPGSGDIAPVFDRLYFDHQPIECRLIPRSEP